MYNEKRGSLIKLLYVYYDLQSLKMITYVLVRFVLVYLVVWVITEIILNYLNLSGTGSWIPLIMLSSSYAAGSAFNKFGRIFNKREEICIVFCAFSFLSLKELIVLFFVIPEAISKHGLFPFILALFGVFFVTWFAFSVFSKIGSFKYAKNT